MPNELSKDLAALVAESKANAEQIMLYKKVAVEAGAQIKMIMEKMKTDPARRHLHFSVLGLHYYEQETNLLKAESLCVIHLTNLKRIARWSNTLEQDNAENN